MKIIVVVYKARRTVVVGPEHSPKMVMVSVSPLSPTTPTAALAKGRTYSLLLIITLRVLRSMNYMVQSAEGRGQLESYKREKFAANRPPQRR